MSVIQGAADDIVLRGGTLWTGEWDSGEITVPNTDNYTLFKIGMDGQATYILAIRSGNYIRGIGGYSSAVPYVYTFHFNATASENTWTFVACNMLKHSDNTITNMKVTSIVGII